MTKNYICVFKMDLTVENDIIDIGMDPDFETGTWGICRPNIRYCRFVDDGCTIVFIGQSNNDEYYFKGFLNVNEKVNCIEALANYPNNKNVIIKEIDKDELETSLKNDIGRKADKLHKKKHYKEYSIDNIKNCFGFIEFNGNFYIQNEKDDHQFENWKCRRIFRCNKNLIHKCLKDGFCKKNNKLADKKGFIIGDAYNYAKFKIPWDDIAPSNLKAASLRSSKGNHRARIIDEKDLTVLKNNLNKFLEKCNEIVDEKCKKN